jgi:hypothetical protein
VTTYRYNPTCPCDVCANGGEFPEGTANNGHSFGYGQAHIPRPMRHRAQIVVLLSWYDEDPAWLRRAILSLGQIPVDHVIALDGPYELYQELHNGPDKSSDEEYEAIRKACIEIGVSFEIHHGGWEGNEVEKRNHLFELGEQAAGAGDWYMVFDGDEFVTDVPSDPHTLLEQTPFHVGAITLIEPGHPHGTIFYETFPMFFRAIRGLRAIKEHFGYTTPDGKKLWGDAFNERLEPRVTTNIRVEHHSQLRDRHRRNEAVRYYKVRDDREIEGLPKHRLIVSEGKVA